MQRHKDFEFNLRELAGSMGDFGTLFPLAVGFIVVCGLARRNWLLCTCSSPRARPQHA